MRKYLRQSKLGDLLQEYADMNAEFEKMARFFCFNPFVFDFDQSVQVPVFRPLFCVLDRMVAGDLLLKHHRAAQRRRDAG